MIIDGILILLIGFIYYKLISLENKNKTNDSITENVKNNKTIWGRIYGKK